MDRNLTPKQLKFIEVYSGNGTEAARLAGYSGDDNVLGVTAHDLLKNPKIVEAIKARQNKAVRPLIASREQRQEFWTETMRDVAAEMRDRLKASELLGKSEADFIDRHEHSGPDGKPIELSAVPSEQIKAEIADLLAKRNT